MNRREFVEGVVDYAKQYTGSEDTHHTQYTQHKLVSHLYDSYEQLHNIAASYNPNHVIDVGSGIGILKHINPLTYSSNSRRHQFFNDVTKHLNIPIDFLFDNIDEPDWFNIGIHSNVAIVSRFFPFTPSQHLNAALFCKVYSEIQAKVDRFVLVRHYQDLEKYVDLKKFRMYNIQIPTYLIPFDATIKPLNV